MNSVIEIQFRIESIFNKVMHESITLTENIEAVNVTNEDIHWFHAALKDACDIVLIEVLRIAKKVDNPVIITDEHINVYVSPTTKVQQSLLPDAIENTIKAFVLSFWFTENNCNINIDTKSKLSYLKKVTLMCSEARRKNTF